MSTLEFTDIKPVEPNPGRNFVRTAEEVEAILTQLREAHERDTEQWAIYSKHKSRGAARQRQLQLRRSSAFKGYPLEWRTCHAETEDQAKPYLLMVRWNPEILTGAEEPASS